MNFIYKIAYLIALGSSGFNGSRENDYLLRTILFYSGHLQHEHERPDMEWKYTNSDNTQRKEPELTT